VKKTSLAGMPCPVARTLDVIGEWWTLVIVRDAFLGARRYDDFRATGIADNILSARLKRLVEDGVFERRPYQARPERFEYHLTEKGRELLPVIGALRSWGEKWTTGTTLNRMTHEACGHEVSVHLYCERCGRPIGGQEVRAARRPAPAAAAG
jgi:DNA-binding HxlR family transcriptional regulator